MTREEIIEREIAFTDDWYRGHTGTPTYADAIEWTRKQMIDKAYEWLKQNAENYVVTCYDEGELNDEDLLNDFKKAMEE